MNFLEGTRFTEAKHDQKKGEYKFLLRPKSGGLALALNVLGDKFNSLLDVTSSIRTAFQPSGSLSAAKSNG